VFCVARIWEHIAHANVSNDSRRLRENGLRPFENRRVDLFGWWPAEPAVNSQSTSRAKVRQDRHAAIREQLRTPWGAWNATGTTARIAMRYLSRYPHLDRPDPAYDLLTEWQRATEYHLEEEPLEIGNEQR
jgi:hypothetical protein